MILLTIPNWANYIVVEMDKTVWAHRYDPHPKNGKRPADSRTESVMIGKYHQHSEKIPTGTTKIQSIVNKEERFFNDKMEIVTRDNRPYKAFALEAWLLSQSKEEEEVKKQKVGDLFTTVRQINFRIISEKMHKGLYSPKFSTMFHRTATDGVAASKIIVDRHRTNIDWNINPFNREK